MVIDAYKLSKDHIIVLVYDLRIIENFTVKFVATAYHGIDK